MKLSIAVIATTLAVSQAFMVAPSGNVQTTQLAMDRRELFSSAAALALSGVVLAPQAAFAGDYEPRFDDMKQIYFLGASLDKLVAKLSNPETVEAGMEGVRMFNRDDKFYTGYAKNFILKSIGKGADSDPRVGYVKNVSSLFRTDSDKIVSCQLAPKSVFYGCPLTYPCSFLLLFSPKIYRPPYWLVR
jgi:hypothetical protein